MKDAVDKQVGITYALKLPSRKIANAVFHLVGYANPVMLQVMLCLPTNPSVQYLFKTCNYEFNLRGWPLLGVTFCQIDPSHDHLHECPSSQ